LVHGEKQKISVLHVGHGAQAAQGGADGNASDGCFGNWRIHDAAVAKLFRQTERNSEGSAKATLHTDVLAEQHHTLIAEHFLPQGFSQSLHHGQLARFRLRAGWQAIWRRHR
jgi:hypothetical protein